MQEEIDFYLAAAEESMQESVAHLQRELVKIRSGKASPDLVSGIRVDYYGSSTPLSQVANVKAADARTVTITPWEKGMIQPIEHAIMQANIGMMPQNDGLVIRLNVPPLTEERRRLLVKQSSGFGEQAKVSIRNARREAVEEIRKAVKNGYSEDAGHHSEDIVQKMTDKHIAEVEAVLAQKEKDIMTV